MSALADRGVVVLGGGRGVGRAHALACAAAGARVLVNDLGCDLHGDGADPEVAEAVAAEIRERGGVAIADGADVAEPGAATRIVARGVSELGRVDAVIGAAGVVADRTVMKMDDALLERMLALHVRAGFELVRAAARAMIDRDAGGSIVLHTGPVGFFGARSQSALAAVSGAVAGLVRSSAIELRRHGIRVNAIAPTARTRSTEELPLFKGIAPDSMGSEFVGPVGAFLVSDHAREVSGEVVGVAGTRLYTLQGRETPGWFGDGRPATIEEIAARWADVSRP